MFQGRLPSPAGKVSDAGVYRHRFRLSDTLHLPPPACCAPEMSVTGKRKTGRGGSNAAGAFSSPRSLAAPALRIGPVLAAQVQRQRGQADTSVSVTARTGACPLPRPAPGPATAAPALPASRPGAEPPCAPRRGESAEVGAGDGERLSITSCGTRTRRPRDPRLSSELFCLF